MELFYIILAIALMISAFIYSIYLSCKSDEKKRKLLIIKHNDLVTQCDKEEPKYSVRIYITREGGYRETKILRAKGFYMGSRMFHIISSKSRCESFIERSFKSGYFDLNDQDRFIPVNEVVDVWTVKEGDDEQCR